MYSFPVEAHEFREACGDHGDIPKQQGFCPHHEIVDSGLECGVRESSGTNVEDPVRYPPGQLHERTAREVLEKAKGIRASRLANASDQESKVADRFGARSGNVDDGRAITGSAFMAVIPAHISHVPRATQVASVFEGVNVSAELRPIQYTLLPWRDLEFLFYPFLFLSCFNKDHDLIGKNNISHVG